MHLFRKATSKQYSWNFSNCEYKLEKTSENNYLLVENDFNKEIEEKIQSLRIDPLSLSSPYKIYFDKTCVFPRAKLTTNDNFSRTIKIEKSDVVCMSINTHSLNSDGYYNTVLVGSDGIIYKLHSVAGNFQNDDYWCNAFNLSNVTFQQFKNWGIYKISDNIADFINNIYNVYNKVILNTDLNMLLDQNDLTNNISIDNIESMLLSDDKETIDLGFRALINLDISKYACKIGSILFRVNRNYIRSMNVNMTYIKSLFNILDIRRSNIIEGPTLAAWDHLYRASSSEDDRKLGKQIVIEMLEQQVYQLKSRAEHYLKNTPITFNIDIY